ncbi:putative quinol monooxygenase [Streptomyces sp. NPDC018584]|uniref:putative quinol monooxygenase n=1 Tax=unclassified Streptomyces TaxID=2593676 RepID=UPI00379CCFD4
MPTPYALHVVFELKDQAAAESFDALVAETLPGIHAEPGTLIYTVHQPVGEPLQRVLYELYADEDAFQVHEEQPHTKRMLRDREQYLAAAPAVTFMHLRR